MIETFSVILQEDIVKLQTVNLAAKLCIANPKQAKLLCQYVLDLAKYDQNYDIRDRARFLRQLVLPGEVSLSGWLYMSGCLLYFLSLCLSVCLSVSQSACPSACLSVCLPCLTVSYCRAGSDLHVHSFMRLSMTTNLLPYRVLLCPSMPKRYCLLPNQLQSLSLPSKVGRCLSR